MDTYATSKLCGERCARSFARRFPGTDIYALRIGNVIEPHEYETDFPDYVNNPETRKRNAWSYVDARDLGQICDLCIRKNGMGFQVFNATNTTSSLKTPTVKFLKEACPNTPVTREMGEFEGPLSNRKAREELGFVEEHPCKFLIGLFKSPVHFIAVNVADTILIRAQVRKGLDATQYNLAYVASATP